MTEEIEPARLTSKEAIGAHGPIGNMMVSLQNYSRLGWIIAFISTSLFIISMFIQILKPEPIIALDATGRVLGTIEYLDGTAREDSEIIATLVRWTDAKLSANSSTIYDDVAFYLTMCSEELYQKETTELASTSAPERIARAGTTSRIQLDEKNTKIINRKGTDVEARIVGKLVIGQKEPVTKEFDIGIVGRVIARSSIKASGFEVDNYWFN